MAICLDRQELMKARNLLIGLTIGGLALYWISNSIPVTPDFLKSKVEQKKKSSKKITVDEVLKLPAKQPEKVVTRVSRAQLDRTIRPSMSSSLRGFGEGGAEMGGSFSESGGGVAGRVEEAALERQARVSRRSEPVFPQAARERGLSGVVTLELEVLANGQVGNIKTLEANPPGYFEGPAIEAAKKWTFEPAIAAGAPVASIVVQKVRFDLE